MEMTKGEEKSLRLKKALNHENPDRIPVSDFFWTGHLLKARQKYGQAFDPYRYYDLDYIVITPNMDPHIKDFEILEQKGEDIILRTGFEAIIKRSGTAPMPHYDSFSIQEPAMMANFEFDNPNDSRRFYMGG